MSKISLFLIVLFICSCRVSLEDEAKSAANDFCNYVKENIFLTDSTNKLFSHCNFVLEKKYRLVHLYFQGMENTEFRNSLSQQTRDSITEFTDYFMQYSDSCHSIPQNVKGQF